MARQTFTREAVWGYGANIDLAAMRVRRPGKKGSHMGGSRKNATEVFPWLFLKRRRGGMGIRNGPKDQLGEGVISPSLPTLVGDKERSGGEHRKKNATGLENQGGA